MKYILKIRYMITRNKLKCDHEILTIDINFYTGTLIEGEVGKGHLYKMDSSYNFTPYADNITLSNGLAWSLNNDTLYYNDSEGKKIFAFDYNLEEGSASKLANIFIKINIKC